MPEPPSHDKKPAKPASDKPEQKPLLERLSALLDDKQADNAALVALLQHEQPAEIAVAFDKLETDDADRVFKALGDDCAAQVLSELSSERARDIVGRLQLTRFEHLIHDMPPREGARVAAGAPADFVEAEKAEDPKLAADAERRAAYAEGSAGRLMTNDFVRLQPSMTVADGLAAVRRTDPDANTPTDVYVVTHVDGKEKMLGVLSIRGLAMAEPRQRIDALMSTDIVTVAADADDNAAANLLSKYKFATLPVIDGAGFLVGVIPSDDLMHVIVARLHRRYARSVGTDSQAMQDATPLQEAKLRVPWLLGTMALELIAGVVISRFNGVLEKIILLASFLPVISAVAGNVGLQAAAITVRGLDTGQMSLRKSGAALLKEGSVTLLMGAVCATVLGTVGAIWSKHLMFGVVIAVALSCSMLTACLMGTIIPMLSKKFGFDPATTAGPFETAFQDVIGFAVFLGLATALLH